MVEEGGAATPAEPAERWESVSRSGKGPKAVCDLCGRERGRPLGPGFGDPEDAVFRRVCVDGAAESVTVCGACFRARAPQQNGPTRPAAAG
jgi:hypothetical protein